MVRYTIGVVGTVVAGAGETMPHSTYPRTPWPNRFRFTGVLGAGGQATVYKARDRWRGEQEVAVKRVSEDEYTGLKAEFAALRRLSHPGVVQAVDLGWSAQSNAGYLIEAFVPGQPLVPSAEQGDPVAFARQLAGGLWGVAHGLAYMHQHGLIHADISPANILWRPGHEACLIDLGALTARGQTSLRFTPAFAAPETTRGEPSETSADIFALAATILYCLTGGGNGRQPQLASIAEGDLAALLGRALDADPAVRPDAVEFALGLGDVAGIGGRTIMKPVLPVPLVGRQTELQQFAVWLGGESPSLTFIGPAGAGKSRLLQACADHARLAEHTVIQSEANEILKIGAQVVGQGLDPAPVMISSPGAEVEEGAAAGPRAADEQHSVESLITQLDQRAEERPMLLIVDDMDAAVGENRRLLDVLLSRRQGSLRLLVAESSPSSTTPSSTKPLQAAATQVRADPVVRPRVFVGPFEDAEVATLLEYAFACPRPEAEVYHLVNLAGRLPGRLIRTLQHWRQVGGSLFHLSPPEEEPLAVGLAPLAYVGGELPAEVLTVLVQHHASVDVLAAVDRAVCAGQAEFGADEGGTGRCLRLRLRRPPQSELPKKQELDEKICAAFVAARLPWRGARFAAAAGDVETACRLLQTDTGSEAMVPSVLAVLREIPTAQRDQAALLRPILSAIERLRRSGQLEDIDAATLLGVNDESRTALRWARAYAALRAGATDFVLVVCAENETAGQEPSSAHRALRARALLLRGQVAAALSITEALMNSSGFGALPVSLVADIGDTFAHAAAAVGRVEEAEFALGKLLNGVLSEASLAQGEASTSRAGFVAQGRVIHALAVLLHRQGRVAQAEPYYRQALDLAEAHNLLARTLNLATVLQDRGALEEALALYREAESLAARLPSPRDDARVGVNMANLLLHLGDLPGAWRRAQDTIDGCRRAQQKHGEAMAILVAAEVSLERGFGESALLLQASQLLRDIDDPYAAAELEMLHGRYAAAEGNWSAAFASAAAIEALGGAAASVLPLLALHQAEWRVTRRDAEMIEASQSAVQLARVGEQKGGTAGDIYWRACALLAQAGALGDHAEAHSWRQQATRAVEAWERQLPPPYRSAYFSVPSRRRLRAFVFGEHHSVRALLKSSPAAATQLRRFMEINRGIAAETEARALFELIVESAVEMLGAERGFLILAEDAASDGPLKIAVARPPVDQEERPLSRTAVRRVLQQGRPLLSTNAQTDPQLAGMRSVVALELRSLLCVPLCVGGEGAALRVCGALYLDHRIHSRVFDDNDLELASALADQAGIALATTHLLARIGLQEEQLRARNEQLERVNAQLRRDVATYAAEADAALRRAAGEGESDSEVDLGVEGMVGHSAGLRLAARLVRRFARTDVPVMIHGESGTGKELIARAIHAGSARRGRRFVSINCGAVVESLMESELFGVVRGAFTGAVRDRIGLIAMAEGGTLFLDEIGEMPAAMQVKLLRVLQDGEYRAVGSSETRRADVRLVCAGHRDLRQLAETGAFRQDLLYRISVVDIELPPLRERGNDVPLLVDHFSAVEGFGAGELFGAAAWSTLVGYGWPGNVRELRNEVVRASALKEPGRLIEPTDLSSRLTDTLARPQATLADISRGSLKDIMAGFEKDLLQATLQRTTWNVKQAAKELGLSRAAMYTRLTRFGLSRASAVKDGED